MTLLIRFILVVTIIYLLIRSFVRYFAEEEASLHNQEHKKETKSNGVSKKVGEYIDYEEVD